MVLSSKKILDLFSLLRTGDHTHIAGFSDLEMSSFDIDDVTVKFDHVVLIIEINVDLPDLSVKTSEFFDETQGGKDEEPCFAHQHERCHNEMDRKKEKGGKDIFEYTVFEPAETQGLREENMLKVSHVPGRKEKKFIIHFKQVVFLCFWFLSGSELCKHGIYFGCTVDLCDNIEGARRVENEGRQCTKAV